MPVNEIIVLVGCIGLTVIFAKIILAVQISIKTESK